MAARKPTKPTTPTLFEASSGADGGARPLADRRRPRQLADLVGQQAVVGPGRLLARAIDADRVPSMILWGPPGSGKTTLARIVAERTEAEFVPFNAVLGGVAEVRKIVSEASEARAYQGRRTILFVDEIHRFNKAQQDAFLPHVERGVVTLIGATTENPSFSVNAPLLSRCKVFRLRALDASDLEDVLRRALAEDEELSNIEAEDEAIAAIARLAEGDARRALTSLEVLADEVRDREPSRITFEDVQGTAEHRSLLYDKAGDEHYSVISAFIKSMRGSDPDASIYWLMRMIEAGDDPLFLLRRMIIFASEDIGNADPRALQVAVSADAAFRRIGLPEGLYPLSQAALYLATAPKSNACNAAWHKAQQVIRERGSLPVPDKLRSAPTALMKKEGFGVGYRYAHSEPEAYAAAETYLPDELVGTTFYEPTGRGYEKIIGERLAYFRSLDKEADK